MSVGHCIYRKRYNELENLKKGLTSVFIMMSRIEFIERRCPSALKRETCIKKLLMRNQYSCKNLAPNFFSLKEILEQ